MQYRVVENACIRASDYCFQACLCLASSHDVAMETYVGIKQIFIIQAGNEGTTFVFILLSCG